MRKKLIIFSMFLFCIMLSACGDTQSLNDPTETEADSATNGGADVLPNDDTSGSQNMTVEEEAHIGGVIRQCGDESYSVELLGNIEDSVHKNGISIIDKAGTDFQVGDNVLIRYQGALYQVSHDEEMRVSEVKYFDDGSNRGYDLSAVSERSMITEEIQQYYDENPECEIFVISDVSAIEVFENDYTFRGTIQGIADKEDSGGVGFIVPLESEPEARPFEVIFQETEYDSEAAYGIGTVCDFVYDPETFEITSFQAVTE